MVLKSKQLWEAGYKEPFKRWNNSFKRMTAQINAHTEQYILTYTNMSTLYLLFYNLSFWE